MLLCSPELRQKSTGQNVGLSAVGRPLSSTDKKKKQFAYERKPLVCVMRKCNITASISAYRFSYCESSSGLICSGLSLTIQQQLSSR